MVGSESEIKKDDEGGCVNSDMPNIPVRLPDRADQNMFGDVVEFRLKRSKCGDRVVRLIEKIKHLGNR